MNATTLPVTGPTQPASVQVPISTSTVADIVAFRVLDMRVGYKVFDRDGFEGTSYRFIEGRWRFRLGGYKCRFAPLGCEHPDVDRLYTPGLAQKLRDFSVGNKGTVFFWQCMTCATPDQRELAQALTAAGGKVTHGFCDECGAKALSEAKEISAN